MKLTELKFPAVIEWDDLLCPHRCTIRHRRYVVTERERANLRTISGDYLYWYDIRGKMNFTVSPFIPDTKKPPQ